MRITDRNELAHFLKSGSRGSLCSVAVQPMVRGFKLDEMRSFVKLILLNL
jgi:hypothetical protein